MFCRFDMEADRVNQNLKSCNKQPNMSKFNKIYFNKLHILLISMCSLRKRYQFHLTSAEEHFQ